MNLRQKLLWGGLFALALGYFEAAVVVYLRELYYPGGFAFPLREMPVRLLATELCREAASILILAAGGYLLGKRFISRFAGFAFGFGVWDLSYYAFLKLLLDWPPSLGTWDLLFLIPMPWVGPVWAPMGVSLGLIGAAVIIWSLENKGIELRVRWWEWALEGFAGALTIVSFLARAPVVMARTQPFGYPWWLWLIGMMLGVGLFAACVHRNLKTR